VVTVKNYIDALNAFLLQSHAAGQSSVLIIDEAQNLSADVLEQLRLLTNLETSERKLLQIVLIGQPELRAMLARPELEQLAQRVIARFHLDALSEPETLQYIEHRLAIAGHSGPPPFDAKALKHIHRLARGVPRRINLLAGRALLGAWATGQHRATRAVVDKAAAEVFGPEAAGSAGGAPARSPWLVGSLGLLAGAGLFGLLVWQAGAPTSGSATTAAVPGRLGGGAPGECGVFPEHGGIGHAGAQRRGAGGGGGGGGGGVGTGAGCSGFGIRARLGTHGWPRPRRGGGLCRQRARRFRLDERPAARPGYRLAATGAGLATARRRRRPLPGARGQPGAVLPRRQPEPAADPPARPPRHPDAAAGHRATGCTRY
jgi:hypothetical protein